MKVKCIRGISLGATGEVFEAGVEYDVPAKVANDYPTNFEKKQTVTKNKKVQTEENK